MSGRRPGALLPRSEARSLSLAVVMAVLCLLAGLAALGAVAGNRAAEGWAREIRGEATVQVSPGPGETGASAAARAAEALAGLAGVEEAAALERDRAEALLRPWLGEAILEDLPIPHLVTVRLDPEAPATADQLRRALAEEGLQASVDDHSVWLADVSAAARTVTALALGVFLATAGAAAAAIVFATAAGLQAHRPLVEVLSLTGATDDYIAGVFQGRFALLAGAAGLVGALAAAAVGALLLLLGGGQGLTPALPLRWSDLLIVSPTPLLAASLAALAARFTILRLLGRGS